MSEQEKTNDISPAHPVKKRMKRKCVVNKDKILITLYHGDCNVIVRDKFTPDSIDAIVTDPPYGISFFNKKWDYELPSAKTFKKLLKVLKPGGTLLCFASPKTQHRMAVNIEDAGFEIRDCIMWLFGSGFPKSQSISTLINKQYNSQDLAEPFSNWRTHALKPAYEPIIVATKPLQGNYAENAVTHNIAGLNIEECRLEHKGKKWVKPRGGIWKTDPNAKAILVDNEVGRFPTNIIYEESEDVIKTLKESVDPQLKTKDITDITRLFYCAKVKGSNKENNTHPTIKPLSLMQYLCRLVKSPSKDCTILDPFMGSGTTGVACNLENINFIGIEKEIEYFNIAKDRCSNNDDDNLWIVV